MISHKRIVIKLLVLLCVFVSGDVEVRCIEKEREALLSFKNGLIDESATLSSWRSDECCEWYGVVCSNTTSHVTGLQLAAYVLRGKVSSSLLELHHLNYLDLSWNDFGGHPIPQFIGSIKQLQHLNLANSNFSGIVPPQLGNLTNLLTLDLSYNPFLRSENLNWLSTLSSLSLLALSASFDLSDTNWPQQILNLHSLQELRLRYCDISDIKPSETLFVNSSLSILDLAYNELTSSIFKRLFNISTSLVSIDLSGNELQSIPKSLENLPRLQILSLSHINIGGPLEEFFGNVSSKEMVSSESPVNLTSLSGLRELILGSNNLTGPIPFSLSQLSQLEVIDVSSNLLEGTITEDHFMKLHNLKSLDLSYNSLSLQIAPDWSPPFQLNVIALTSCNMGPYFPKWIRTQKDVSYLDVSVSSISDEVPIWLWGFSPALRYLNLSHNQISGTIPDLSSTSIHTVDVTANKLSGHVPILNPNAFVFQLSQNMFSGSISHICANSTLDLFILDLSNNQFEGELPNCWENTPYLQILNLANNSFYGGIPHALGSLRELKTLLLRENNLSGEWPSSLTNCKSLEMIDVGGNMLTGYIPPWIGAYYTDMKILILGHNRFYGSIPSEICNLTLIRILDLSHNNISGEIPHCFNKFTSFVDKSVTSSSFWFTFSYSARFSWRYYMEYALIQWKGRELEYRKTLHLLKLIDLSSNKLVGKIPESFSGMRALISLNLSRNSLTGNIIPDIGQMEMLECLDLSSNQLSGEIPTGLARLHFLDVLDLANNTLSGTIPSGTQLQSFDASVYAGNKELCGRPLSKLCPEEGQSPVITAHGEDIKEKDEWQEIGISMAFGFIIGFWGIVGSLLLKKSWRYAYFNSLDATGDWLYVTTTIFLSKFKRS